MSIPTRPKRLDAAERFPAGVSWTQTALTRAEGLVANPLVAYGAVLFLQVRVIWNVWRYKDLTYGDSASYFVTAASWAHHLRDNIVWSPLYTNFWGTIFAVVGDVYAAAMVHRIAIVLTAAVLVLALMRALLEPALALLLALWWVVLPPNFDALYEVHLFGLLPVLTAALVVRRSPGHRALGITLAVLAGAALLLRNELVIATVILAVAIVVHEVRSRGFRGTSVSAYTRAYGLPLVIVCLLVGGAYARSEVQGEAAKEVLRIKHTLNICQIYAFNYQQRHPTQFVGSPWLDCAPLMRRTFGRPMPSFLQATTANPGAIVDFVAWNGWLLPGGLQVSLFGATVTNDNPDYVPVESRRLYPLVLSLGLLALVIAGLAVMLKDRQFWIGRLVPLKWSLIVLGGVAVTTLVVAFTQRPRPEYMYGLSIGVLVLTGFSASALLRRWRGRRLFVLLSAGVTLALCAAWPTYYQPGPRPLHDAVDRLQVVRGSLQRQDSVLVTAGDGLSMCYYLADGPRRHCSSPSLATLTAQITPARPLRDVLVGAGATVIYAGPTLWADPTFGPLLGSPRSFGWVQVAEGVAADGQWSVLERTGP